MSSGKNSFLTSRQRRKIRNNMTGYALGASAGRVLHRRTVSRRAAGCLSGALLLALGTVRIFF